MINKRINRRTFLKGAGVTMALPLLESMGPMSMKAVGAAAKTSPVGSPIRMVCIGNPLGLMPDSFFPTGEGENYKLSELLSPITKHRKDFTVFSNLDHDISGGHSAVHAFLSGIKDQDASDWPEGNISVDQRASEFVGARTRFPSLVMSVGEGSGDLKCKLSWTRNGVNVPPVTRARDLFRALFVDEDPTLLQKRQSAYDINASILDAVSSQAKILSQQLGKADQDKLDEYLSSVREVEKKLGMSREWLHKPKPVVDMEEPGEGSLTYTTPAFYDLLALALQTDSTRVATLGVPGTINTADLGLSGSYHGFSHHGKAEKLRQGLLVIEKFQVKQMGRFLDRLKEIKEPDGTSLLDRTMVLMGSGMGNGSSHSNKNLPVVLAGGGFKHGEHKIYPEVKHKRVPLCNLYGSMLQRFGLEIDTFNKGTGTLTGLELA
ncbi:MAG: DUF1552 domain-containing protein [Verrucomicrobiae bacterium]|nr:DUF1552 domain-containing protein [Verrucomicrobiae bacterium]